MSKLLSQGGFGCVYYPGIRCSKAKNDDNMEDYVTKLQRYNFNSKNEANIGLRIAEDIDYKYFFLPVISECPIKLASFSKENEELISKCEVIKDVDKEYTLMKIPYANNKPIVDQIFDVVRSKKHTVMSILESYTHLLKAIEYMVNINIVHFDLKSDNVLYDSDMNHANIIDFGLSIPIDKINGENMKEYFYIYAPEYYVWPLEVHIINYLLYEYEEGEEVDDIASLGYRRVCCRQQGFKNVQWINSRRCLRRTVAIMWWRCWTGSWRRSATTSYKISLGTTPRGTTIV